ncbi:hypothetical protein QWI17_12240 [Gilvimarinus sp. SDUM040013]|uniref:Uncharacterized protein n=1 Tax=Gilvimarinus gilvus TaxID=3058038 RepID=A0ABU4RZC1_9GAMM|nr:hypothetical protein [Gilvimarinus sp. SDUM040013]MDO3386607.1 hypothetical protein [Gilvimarinus sp. SDUM040013]MDX6849506.1 hypothetical protein [Gilvimarinus sp. SDUM040013]
MIYIEANGLKRQLELLALISKMESCELVIWLYPESRIRHLAGALVSKNHVNFVPITTYEDRTEPRCTSSLPAHSNSILALKTFISKLERNSDSIALYPAGEKDWSACSVGHEGVCLVKNERLLFKIQSAGFTASLTAPSWW